LVESGYGTVGNTRISDRETDYQRRKNDRIIQEDGLSFAERMQQTIMEKEKVELIHVLQKQQQEVNEPTSTSTEDKVDVRRKRRRWDASASEPIHTDPIHSSVDVVTDTDSVVSKGSWDDGSTHHQSQATNGTKKKRWDETPVVASVSPATTSTPLVTSNSRKWDETPVVASGFSIAATPIIASAVTGRNRWDATPLPPGTDSSLNKAAQLEREMESRNRPWTDSALDAILPAEGYTIIRPPTGYKPIRTPAHKLLATPTPMGMTPTGFQMEIPIEQRQDASMEEIRAAYGVPLGAPADETGIPGSLPSIKPDDMQYFGRLLEKADEDKLSKGESKERQIMMLLLKIKSGTPPQRKTAMRQITDKARFFGAGPLFNQILPLLMSPSLEDQERHLLVKVIDRVLYKLEDLVRPYVHRILAVIEPLLIDEDYYARVEGREIISNLAKAAGLPTMIATMRPDIDSPDEYVRNTTSRAFAVVASALGVPALLPFLKAVCQSRKSWQARHTGIKIVQQIALLMGVAVLPFLRDLVEIISHGLTDEMQKVKIITALTCAALAEAAHPYGIEGMDAVIRPLWKGAMEQHGKALAAFLKAIGFVIPLMEEKYASHYTRLVMPILLREFHSPDEEMKRIVLKVIQQCVATAGVEPEYIRTEILPEFFRNFWIRRMALDRRNYNQVIETTEELANKVGCTDIISRVVDDLKDDSEPYRRMVMETVKRVLENLGASDIDTRLEERLLDGILYAFQEQAVDASVSVSNTLGRESQVMLDGFGTVVNTLGERCKPYLKQIAGTIKWRLNNKAASVRMQSADLISRIALVMKACGEDQLMGHLGVVLYEYLGEEYPEVLGSILGALRAIVNVIGMTKMTPPIRDLLPRLTPILRNRHEKVQENVIDLVGRIADRGAEFVSAKEWMRICFELLEMVRAHKKAIRRAAVSTFGFIAKAIGPQDVLHTLLNNLKVQDRQMRVCTTVAIAIVAETCGPFTVLPALMNEYRVPELNIQNGVLKALSFVFEYIGEMGKDYIYAVTPLLEDALMERDPVHRQTACATVKHLALGVAGHGCEDALIHILNFVWPNIFEESPHVIQAVFDAIQGLMVALGPNLILQYTLQGLYHPARKVRDVYWRIYNCLYLYNSDALVAGYPMIENEGMNTYARTSLELFI
jgi:splicing factor 3B subunit 1